MNNFNLQYEDKTNLHLHSCQEVSTGNFLQKKITENFWQVLLPLIDASWFIFMQTNSAHWVPHMTFYFSKAIEKMGPSVTVILKTKLRNSTVSNDTRLMAVFRFPIEAGTSLLAWMFRPALGPTQPLTQHASAVVSSGVKQPERDTDHLPPSNTKV
jgi:hypothetical protein